MLPPTNDVVTALFASVTDPEQADQKLHRQQLPELGCSDIRPEKQLAPRSQSAGSDASSNSVPQHLLSATLLDRVEEAALGRAIRENRSEVARHLSAIPAAAESVLRALSEAKAGNRPLTDVLMSPYEAPEHDPGLSIDAGAGDKPRRSAATNLKASAVLQGSYDKWLRAHKRDPSGAEAVIAAQRLTLDVRRLPLASVSLKEALDACLSLDGRVRDIELSTAMFHADILSHGSTTLAAVRTELLALQREAGTDLTSLRESCRVGCAAYEGYARARKRLVEANLRLAFSMANKLRNRNVSLDDLFQEATIGVMRATEKFDERRGYKFSTYAVQWIRQALFRCFADTSRTVRLPAHMHEKTLQLRKHAQRLESTLGREPTMAELVTESDTPIETVEMALRGMNRTASLDAPVAGYDGLCLLDAVATDDGEDELAAAADAERINGVTQALLEKLPPRERLVVRLRHGIDCAEPHTLEKIGAILGVTRERARQLEARAMQTLRDHAGPRARDAMIDP